MNIMSDDRALSDDVCPDWCTHCQRELDARVEGDEPYHHAHLAVGHETDTHGPLYSVQMEEGSDRTTRLWVEVNSVTLTADQAEVVGKALLRGADLLRQSPRADRAVTLKPFFDVNDQLVRIGPIVYPLTSNEQDVHDRA